MSKNEQVIEPWIKMFRSGHIEPQLLDDEQLKKFYSYLDTLLPGIKKDIQDTKFTDKAREKGKEQYQFLFILKECIKLSFEDRRLTKDLSKEKRDRKKAQNEISSKN